MTGPSVPIGHHFLLFLLFFFPSHSSPPPPPYSLPLPPLPFPPFIPLFPPSFFFLSFPSLRLAVDFLTTPRRPRVPGSLGYCYDYRMRSPSRCPARPGLSRAGLLSSVPSPCPSACGRAPAPPLPSPPCLYSLTLVVSSPAVARPPGDLLRAHPVGLPASRPSVLHQFRSWRPAPLSPRSPVLPSLRCVCLPLWWRSPLSRAAPARDSRVPPVLRRDRRRGAGRILSQSPHALDRRGPGRSRVGHVSPFCRDPTSMPSGLPCVILGLCFICHSFYLRDLSVASGD